MKKTLLFASAAVLLCGCGTGSKYVVEGHIAGLEGTVYMFEGDSTPPIPIFINIAQTKQI